MIVPTQPRAGSNYYLRVREDLIPSSSPAMARSVRTGTMAIRPSTTAWDGKYRLGSEIAQGEELLQEVAPSGFQFGQSVGQKAPHILSIYTQNNGNPGLYRKTSISTLHTRETPFGMRNGANGA
jgi:hypothetical protein